MKLEGGENKCCPKKIGFGYGGCTYRKMKRTILVVERREYIGVSQTYIHVGKSIVELKQIS